jgi:glutamate dehydrogenase
VTQKGRIEAAFAGVRLNTDAIDNSAGVNTSDVEVNIKIALARPEREGSLSRQDRNALLVTMTDEVAALVLRNNYLQTLALSLAERRGAGESGFLIRLMQNLEHRGLLDRTVEFLPDDAILNDRIRRGQGLTRPELAVLLAYAKLTLHDDLLASAVPDDPYLARELIRYFPKELRERFPQAIEAHRLRRDIISTVLANSIINRGGPAAVVRLMDETGADVAYIASAFAAVRDTFGMQALNGAIDQLDNKVRGGLQLELYATVQDLLLSRAVWFIRNIDLRQGLDAVVSRFGGGVAKIRASLETILSPELAETRRGRRETLVAEGVPADLAEGIADLPALSVAPDLVLVAERTGRAIPDVAATHFAAESVFRLDRIVAASRDITAGDYFERLAIDRAVDQIASSERRLVAAMVVDGKAGAGAVESWLSAHPEADRIRRSVEEIAASGLTLAKLTVAANLLGDLVRD